MDESRPDINEIQAMEIYWWNEKKKVVVEHMPYAEPTIPP